VAAPEREWSCRRSLYAAHSSTRRPEAHSSDSHSWLALRCSSLADAPQFTVLAAREGCPGLRGRSYRGGARALFVSSESPQSRECEYQSEQKIEPVNRVRCGFGGALCPGWRGCRDLDSGKHVSSGFHVAEGAASSPTPSSHLASLCSSYIPQPLQTTHVMLSIT
jgi:hypothetical protein